MSRLIHCKIFTFALALCYSSGSDTEGDDCTSGFMSVDRMDRLLRISPVNSLGTTVASENYQGIFPEVGFTCSGSISGLLFGAQYSSFRSLLPELQIWRPDGVSGSYTRVGNASIDPESSSTYQNYTLSSPLPFQAGDVIGIYQPHPDRSHWRIYMQGGGRRKTVGYFYSGFTPASDLYLPWGERVDARLIMYIISDVPGCVTQFMSVERIRLLLNRDSIGSPITTGNRQLISPEMNFTCDGMITKWILGADWSITIGDTLFPELQIWRNTTNGTFEKISGIQIYFYSQHSNRSYEYSRFSPIPVKAGDILGIFLPPYSDSRLRLRSESYSYRLRRPTQYYINTGTSVISPYKVIDLENNNDSNTVRSSTYHPLVSVEFVRSRPTTSVTVSKPASVPLLGQSTGVGVKSTSSIQNRKSSSTLLPVPSKQNSNSEVMVYISMSVALLMTSLLALTFFVISLILCVRGRKKMKFSPTNVAGGNRERFEMSGNTLYGAAGVGPDDAGTGGGGGDGGDGVGDEEKYECVTNSGGSSAPKHIAPNQAYGLLKTTD